MKRALLAALAGAVSFGCSARRGEVPPGVQEPEIPGSTFQVHSSFSEDPRTSATIVWQTSGGSPSFVTYGATPYTATRRVNAVRGTYPQATGVVHEAVLRDLEPGRRFYYRVGEVVGSFHTAPPGPESFTFLAAGDFGSTPDTAKNVKRMAEEKAAFWLALGDLSYANGDQPKWDRWLRVMEPLSLRSPVMATIGNHDDEGEGLQDPLNRYSAYLTRLALPPPETWYSFDWGGVRFLSWNSNDFDSPAAQKWLAEELAKAKADPAVKWRVVFQHHPLYSTTASRGDDVARIAVERALLDTYEVDLVLAGHNHNYERTHPMKGGALSKPGEHGVVFVVAGAGGQSLYDFADEEAPAHIAARAKEFHYLRVFVTSRKLVVEAVRSGDGSVLDRFVIPASSVD